VELEVQWSADDAESYPAIDPDTLTIAQRREAITVSWFTNAGELADAATGRGESDAAQSTSTNWTAPASPTIARIWIVMRDSRGGVDFATVQATIR
jgi:hypothetical protein